MRFFEPAENQSCYYCKKIHTVEDGYPIRNSVYSYENYVYRCTWHSRFQCSKCGKEYHFSWFYWCPETKELVCGGCSKPRLYPVKFWDRTYAYEFYCETCDTHHYDLLYSEYCGTHPWQIGIFKLKNTIGSSDPWQPMWCPETQRSGEALTLEESLRLENRVFALRKELSVYEPVAAIVPENDMNESETEEAWERFSEEWLTRLDSDSPDEGDMNRRYVIDPALMKLIGDVSGHRILDAGCGNGYLSRKLARLGATVTGVDFTSPFIDYCKRRESENPLGCTFIQASLDDLSFFDEKMFDLVVSNIVMVDVVNFKQAFREICRVLTDDGRFIWSNTHPVFGRSGSFDVRLPSDTARPEERYLKLVDRYFDSGGILFDWDGHNLWQIDRTLEEYSKALKQAGLVISEIIEPRPSNEAIQENPRYFAFDGDRWTHFIIFECMKR